MPDSSTIQEFLVSIGFKTDDAGRARFDAALASNKQRAAELDATLAQVGKQLGILGDQLLKISDRPTREATDAADRIAKRHAQLSRNVKQLGFEAVATTGAFVTGFTEIAKQYDNLYYMAQRAGVSTAKLSAQQFAGSQVGGLDIAGMQAAVTQATQTNPGIANFFGSSNLDEVINKIQVMSHGQTYLIAAFAQMAGLSYQQVMQYLRNQPAIKQAEEEHLVRLRQAGIETDKVFGDTAQGKIGETGKIVRSLNTLWDSLDIAMVKGFDEAYPAAQKLLDVMNNLASANLTLIKNNPGTALKETIAAAYVTVMGALGAVKGIFGIGPGAAGMARALPPLAIGQSLGVLGMGINPFPSHAGSPEEAADSWKKGSWQPPPGYVSPAQQALSWLKAHAPSFAEGGVVPATVHAGEIVLPQSLSSMLLQVASSGSGGGGLLSTFTESFRSWLGGSTSYHPVVQVLGLDVNALNSIAYGDSATRGGTGGDMPGTRRGGVGGAPVAGTRRGTGTGSLLGGASIPAGSDEEMARAAIAGAGGNAFAQAGLLANFYAESGLRRDRPGPGGDFGWAQWVGSRKLALFNYAKAKGISPYSAEAQAGYLRQELSNPGFHKMIERMNASGSATAAAVISGFAFEQGGANPSLFGGGHFDQAALDRFHSKGAESIYSRISGGATTSRSPFPPWVKFNSSGQPYELNMTDQERRNQASSYAFIKSHPTSWLNSRSSGPASGAAGINLNHPVNVVIHATGESDVGAKVIAALNTHSGRFLRNARAAIT